MSSKIAYFLVRHVPDVLRNEPRNIGVILAHDDQLVARFVGEASPDSLDLRRVPHALIPDRQLFAEWHHFWRGKLKATAHSSPNAVLEELVRASTPAYSVVTGGDWHEDSTASVEAIADSLFRRVVDRNAPSFPTVDEEGTAQVPQTIKRRSVDFGDAIQREFAKLQILELAESRELFFNHLVRVDARVRGTNPVAHVPRFLQDNGRRYVMEQVDFAVRDEESAREHAAYAAYMLGDIAKANTPIPSEPIAVVNRVSSEASTGEAALAQQYGLAVLSEHPEVRIVAWDDLDERRRFLEERVSVARL